MQYRIGEVQKILGISPETLRYFEKMNIVKAKRNEHNRYRYYEAEDINKIFVYKMYRSMDFSMEDSIELVSGKSIEQLYHKITQHKELLENRKSMLDALISNLTYSSKIIEQFSAETKNFELSRTDDMYFFENQQEDEFIINEEKSQMIQECYKQLHSCMPAFCCTYQSYRSMCYGYAMITKEIDPNLAKLGTYIGQKRCFHGLVKVKDKSKVYQIVFDQIKLAEETYRIKCNKKIYGRMYHEEREGGSFTWYHEIWALIDDQDERQKKQ